MNINLSEIPTDLILNLLNIVVLFLIVRTLVYRPVRKFMDERTARVQEARTAAEAQQKEAQLLAASYEEKSKTIQQQADQQAQERLQKAEKDAQAIVAQAQQQSEQILSDAQARAQSDYQKKMDEMQKDISDLACRLSGAILSREIQAQDYDDMIKDFLKRRRPHRPRLKKKRLTMQMRHNDCPFLSVSSTKKAN